MVPAGSRGRALSRLPPKVVRRVLLAPLVFVLSLALLVLTPALLLVAFVVDLIARGGWRTVRLIAFGAVYLVYEVCGLVALLALWVGSGFGVRMSSPRMQDRHYRFMRWWLHGIDA